MLNDKEIHTETATRPNDIYLTPVMCLANDEIIAYEFGSNIHKQTHCKNTSNSLDIKSLLEFFMLRSRIALAMRKVVHLTLPMELLHDAESINEIAKFPHADRLHINIQDVALICKSQPYEFSEIQCALLKLQSFGWKIWFSNLKKEQFNFINNLCAPIFGIKINQSELCDNRSYFQEIHGKLNGNIIITINDGRGGALNKSSNYQNNTFNCWQSNWDYRRVVISDFNFKEKTESINSTPLKIFKYYSDIEDGYLLEGILHIIYAVISRIKMTPVIFIQIEKEIRHLADITIIDTTEIDELYNCQLRQQNRLNNPSMLYIIYSENNKKVDLPCMQQAVIIYANSLSSVISKEINRITLNHGMHNHSLTEDFIKGECPYQQLCQRRCIIPIEHEVLYSFSTTNSLNETAERLSISSKAASYYKRSAMKKLDINNNNDLLDFVRKYL